MLIPGLGYIPLGPLSITLLHVTVIIAAVTLGANAGALVGLTWGLITWVRAFVAPTSALAAMVMVNPLVSVLPRVLLGWFAGLVFTACARKLNERWGAVSAAICGSVTNTVLVLGLIYLLFHNQTQMLYHLPTKLIPYLLGAGATNGVVECIAAIILVPAIALPLRRKMG